MNLLKLPLLLALFSTLPVAAQDMRPQLIHERVQGLSEPDQVVLAPWATAVAADLSQLPKMFGSASHGFVGAECLAAADLEGAVAQAFLDGTFVALAFDPARSQLPPDSPALALLNAKVGELAADLLQSPHLLSVQRFDPAMVTGDTRNALIYVSRTRLLELMSASNSCVTRESLCLLVLRAALGHVVEGWWAQGLEEQDVVLRALASGYY